MVILKPNGEDFEKHFYSGKFNEDEIR